MRTLALILVLSSTVLAQTSAPSLQFRGEPGSKHATLVASPTDLSAVPGKVTLFLDVTPKPGIHVYTPGSKDYIPISIKIEPSANVKPGKLAYPKSELMTFGDEKVPVFQKAFRLTQEVVVDKSLAGTNVSVAATVHLQACDDRVCFPPENVPVKWNVTVK